MAWSADVEPVAAKDVTSDRDFVHLVRSVVNARGALVAPPERERGLVGESNRSMRLDGAVEDALEYPGDEELDDRDFVARLVNAVLVDRLRRAEDHEARGVNLGAAVGDPFLDYLP